jgi:DNA-binding response OmpR family regulator
VLDPTRLRALVAAPDPSEVGLLASVLGSAGHEVITAYRAETALARIVDERPDVVLVDPALGDGVAVVARARAYTEAPLLVIADLRDEAVVVAALEAGAVDVIGRPIRPLELLARVLAATRRLPRLAAAPPSLDGLRVDVGRREATVAGRLLQLTPTEFDLLAAMTARVGAVLDHRLLLRAAWPDPAAVDPDTLRSHLNRLNGKLIAAGHPGLRNVRGRGYGLRLEGGRLEGD